MISASHCFTELNTDYQSNPTWDELSIYFGLDNIDLTFLPSVQSRKIKTVNFHKDYEFPQAYYDLAIVELNKPVELGLQVEPLCLPDIIDYQPDSMSGQSASLIGYGPDPDSDKSTGVNLITHTIEPQGICAAKYNAEKTVDTKLRQRLL